MNYAIIDSTGEIVKLIAGSDEVVALNIPPNCSAVAFGGNTNAYWDKSAWVDKGERPRGCRWDAETKAWVDQRSLDDIKAERWVEIKSERSRREFSPLDYLGHSYDANPESQQKITGAMLLATLADSTWMIDWTTADNTVQTLTRDELLGLGQALAIRTNQLYDVARQLRQELASTTTVASALAIQWPA